MNQQSFLLLLATVSIPLGSAAADAAKPALPAKSVPPFELKTKSSFTTNGITRNPFIPIGWKQVVQPVDTGKPAPTVTANEGMFRVSSILLGGAGAPSLAVINGRSYEEGQMIRMQKGAPQVKARVFRIGDGSVKIQVENEVLTVPLRRGELNEKRPDAQLSTEEP